jgi:hypothetical protein
MFFDLLSNPGLQISVNIGFYTIFYVMTVHHSILSPAQFILVEVAELLAQHPAAPVDI